MLVVVLAVVIAVVVVVVDFIVAVVFVIQLGDLPFAAIATSMPLILLQSVWIRFLIMTAGQWSS